MVEVERSTEAKAAEEGRSSEAEVVEGVRLIVVKVVAGDLRPLMAEEECFLLANLLWEEEVLVSHWRGVMEGRLKMEQQVLLVVVVAEEHLKVQLHDVSENKYLWMEEVEEQSPG